MTCRYWNILKTLTFNFEIVIKDLGIGSAKLSVKDDTPAQAGSQHWGHNC